jgi:putative selenium metabolism hydrolase
MEIEVRTQGLSCHGSAPERGVNAIYRMAPIIADIERLNERLRAWPDRFLGPGSVTISEIRSTSPSLCAVADSSAIHLDRRLTAGETLESAVAQIAGTRQRAADGGDGHRARLRPAVVHRAHLPDEEVLPDLDDGRGRTRRWRRRCTLPTQTLGARPPVGKWTFSTNGVATCGMFGVPTVGFGPGHEIHAHSPDDQCPVDHLTHAAAFYAAFPQAFVRATRTPR